MSTPNWKMRFTGNRLAYAAIRGSGVSNFALASPSAQQWFQACGNQNWKFDESGWLRRRETSLDDGLMKDSQRNSHQLPTPRRLDAPGLGQLVR